MYIDKHTHKHTYTKPYKDKHTRTDANNNLIIVNNLNYQEIKFVNFSQIISVTNFHTLKFDYLRFTINDFTTVWLWTCED